MWLDTIKATKLAFDPVSDCFGSVLGTICCVATEVFNAANDRNTPATRHDVVHANQIRRNEAAEANACYKLGSFAGDALVDIASSTVGFFIGAPRAAYLACTGDNDRTNTVLGYSRDDINEVQLFDSCGNCCC